MLSDHWSYPVRGWRPVGPSWNQPQAVCGLGAAIRPALQGPRPPIGTSGTGPDSRSWDGTRERFYETFVVADGILREELGAEARIVGPSTTRWRLNWIEGLAEFCLERGCRFEAVSWHDLANDMHARCLGCRSGSRARVSCCPGRATGRSGVREFHVNEIVGQHIQFKPGAAVGYFSELDRARADVAIKSCSRQLGTGELRRTDAQRSARLVHRPAPIALVHLARLCRRSLQPGAFRLERPADRRPHLAPFAASQRSPVAAPQHRHRPAGGLGSMCGLRALTAGRKARLPLRAPRRAPSRPGGGGVLAYTRQCGAPAARRVGWSLCQQPAAAPRRRASGVF